MKKIEIYTTNYCPFSVKAKSLLNKKKIKFSEIDVSNDEALREKYLLWQMEHGPGHRVTERPVAFNLLT